MAKPSGTPNLAELAQPLNACLPTVKPEEVWTTRVDNSCDVPIIERRLRYFDPGLDQEGVARRLAEVADLLAKACELNSDVSWG